MNPLITEYSELLHRLGTQGGTKEQAARLKELSVLLKDIIIKNRKG